MDNYEVYEWIDMTTLEPFYVGRGKGGRKYVSNRNSKFNNRIKKIGIENCAVVVLHRRLDNVVSSQLEVWYIDEYRNFYGFNICNITDGGEGGEQNVIRTKEHKRKISEKLNGRSEKDKEIWKNKISVKNKGKVWTTEERQRLSKSLKGKKLTKSQMNSLRARKGDKNPFYGKHHTKETKEKIANRMIGGKNPFASKFEAIFPNGEVIIFETRKEMESYFSKEHGISSKPLVGMYNSNKEFNPRWKKHKHLKGLRITKLNQKH